MAKYRKKPVVIDAVHYDEKAASFGWGHVVSAAHPWLEEAYDNEILSNCGHKTDAGITDLHLEIKTPEGVMRANPGDWIIRGVKGEIYPCKDEIFRMTYEPA